MPIYQTAHYQVKPDAIDRVKQAIVEFVAYVRENEPGARVYQSWQLRSDPTHFLHLFIFENEDAASIHSQSAAVAHFESVYTPELVGGPVIFTNYDLVATNDG